MYGFVVLQPDEEGGIICFDLVIFQVIFFYVMQWYKMIGFSIEFFVLINTVSEAHVTVTLVARKTIQKQIYEFIFYLIAFLLVIFF